MFLELRNGLQHSDYVVNKKNGLRFSDCVELKKNACSFRIAWQMFATVAAKVWLVLLARAMRLTQKQIEKILKSQYAV